MSDGIYGSINLIVSVGINYNLDLGGEKKDTGGYYEEQVILESFKEIVEKVLEGMLRRKTIAFLIDTNLYLIFILTTILYLCQSFLSMSVTFLNIIYINNGIVVSPRRKKFLIINRRDCKFVSFLFAKV